jgi:hypothetical protein
MPFTAHDGTVHESYLAYRNELRQRAEEEYFRELKKDIPESYFDGHPQTDAQRKMFARSLETIANLFQEK